MTEAETLGFLNDTLATVNDNWMMFITVFFAYIVCVYVAGRKLSFVQALALTAAYSIFSLISVFAIIGSGRRLMQYADKYPGILPSVERVEFMFRVSFFLLLFIWLISVIYMVSENRKRDGDAV